MKVLKVSEILPELDASIKKKDMEKKQILDIRNSLNRIIDLDHSLTGQTGVAIKEHLTVLHIPAILLFNQFLDDYMQQLKAVKSSITSYENTNGLVRQDFIEYEVKQGLNQLERITEDLLESINNDFNDVSDLVGGSTVTIAPLYFPIERARKHNKTVLENLNVLDYKSMKELQSSTDALQSIASFIGKIKGWSTDGIALSDSDVKEIEKYFSETDVISKLIDSALKLSIEQGDSTFEGNVADWLDKIGKMNGGIDAAKGSIAAAVLLSNRIALTKDGKGNFVIKA